MYMQACNLQTHSAGVSLHSASWRGMHEAAVAALVDATEVTLHQTQAVGPSLSPTKYDFPGLYSFNLAASLFPVNPFLSAYLPPALRQLCHGTTLDDVTLR